MKIGIDLLEIERIKTDEKFLNKILTPCEIEYVNKFETVSRKNKLLLKSLDVKRKHWIFFLFLIHFQNILEPMSSYSLI